MGGGPRPAHGAQGTGSAVRGSACPAPRTRTGTRQTGAPAQQYTEGPRGEARWPKARRSSEPAIVAEALMNNAG
jgi:hypothetical protein